MNSADQNKSQEFFFWAFSNDFPILARVRSDESFQ